MKTKILIIEDNDEVRENTSEILSLNGYEVLSSKNGHDGFIIAESSRPDLILCDLMMPQTDGREFLQMALSSKIIQHTAIVFFSAGSSTERAAGRDKKYPFLKKPFTEQELLDIIAAGLCKRHGPPETNL